jgi:hypothetical protein
VGLPLSASAARLKAVLKQHLGWQFELRQFRSSGEADKGMGTHTLHTALDLDVDEDGPVLVEDPDDFIRL